MRFVIGRRNKLSGISWRHGLKALVALTLIGCSGASTRVASPPIEVKSEATTTTSTTTTPITVPPETTTSVETIPVPEETTTIPDNIIVELATRKLSEIETLICAPKYDWDCREALAVSWCESGHKPRAVSPPNRNGTIDRGLWQVNDVWRDAFPRSWGGILDPVVNTEMAYHIWKVGKRSWLYWTCQP